MTIEYTIRARRDLAIILRWHRERQGRERAIAVLEDIERRVDVLID